LESAGIVVKRENSRSTQWKLDRRRFLIDEMLLALFDGEARHAGEIVAAIKSRLERAADAVVIVGEAARGRLTAGAPLELVVLCETGKRRALNEKLRLLVQELDERFGLALGVSIMAKREAPSRLDIQDGWQLLPTEGRPSALTAAR
jgi:predicted nucleotidyltransferase